ncbi:hypothetical protein [Chryseobacterium taihuense]|uniref:DUF2007 domain-containing protein n=1 Tax=Chryseobacterium taihuense TaxID=1141221 RepID=A0ABY0QTU9_9FLAO|nr:hypothetical protein [Chryseobacterium taihuense]SDL89724.1 hypothetical protein SAMN05216273_10874 [Chryseobacterium taihuense]
MDSVFRKSSDKYIIEEIASVLDRHSIIYKTVDNEKDFDPSFSTNQLRVVYQILIADDDFMIANKALSDYYANEIDIHEDYYLFEYSDDELKDIIFKKDEWNEFDYEAAKRILKQRGENISDEEIDVIDGKRLNSLRNDYENLKEVKNYVILGYIFAIIGCILSLVWGLLIFVSFGIAIAIIKLKKQLPNGERIYYFNERDRKHGQRILWLSITFTVFWMTIFITRI